MRSIKTIVTLICTIGVSSGASAQEPTRDDVLTQSARLCESDDFDAERCVEVVAQLERLLTTDPVDVAVMVSIGAAYLALRDQAVGTADEPRRDIQAREIAGRLRSSAPEQPAGALLMAAIVEPLAERAGWLREALQVREDETVRRELANVLLAMNDPVGAAQEASRSLGSGRRDEDALTAAIGIATVIDRMGESASAAGLIGQVVAASYGLSREGRCRVFSNVAPEELSDFPLLVFRLRELQENCR